MQSPKELKTPLDLLPPTVLHEIAWALHSGAKKYGRYNWRTTGVRPEVYYAAMLRHLTAWASGIDMDPESKCHHLAHVAACCAVILDAQECRLLTPWETKLTDHRSPDEVERILTCQRGS